MEPGNYIEIFLQPGEFYFGDHDTRIRTLLGSCVAVTMWHPRKFYGGMCHCLLPAPARKAVPQLDGRYIEDALLMFLRDSVGNECNPKEMEVKVFGGGDMFPTVKKANSESVGQRNAQTVRMLLQKFGLAIKAEHLGGQGHRVIIFDVWSGNVHLKHMPQMLAAS
jgi:chemotaxis protein CheD